MRGMIEFGMHKGGVIFLMFDSKRCKKLKKLNDILSQEDRRYVILLIPFALLIAAIEMVGVSAVMPFIHVATDFAAIHQNHYYKVAYAFFGFRSEVDFVLTFAVLLVLFYLFRALMNQLFNYAMARFSKRCSRDISLKLFKKYIGFSYRSFIERNSARLIKGVLQEANNISSIVSAYFRIVTEGTILLVIYIFLLFVSWKITLLLTFFLLLNGLLLLKTLTPRIRESGQLRERSQRKFYEILNSTFGNFKIMKLRSNESELLEVFNEAGEQFMQANIRQEAFSQTPKIYLEAVGFIMLILLVGYWVEVLQSDIRSKIAVLGVFILALYRMMPSVSHIIFYYNQAVYLEKSLEIVHADLSYDVEKIGTDEVVFNEKIELKDVWFEYLQGKPIIQGINLTIPKGKKIAFVGESGSGKSTLVDIIIGLYKPLSGSVYVDDMPIGESNIRSWRRKIGYIPQDIYLLDGSVAQNVAFEREYEAARVVEVLRKAHIYDFLIQHHEGIDTQVGENGVKLSGGQKQRIAIARALYHDPEVLVLDEATSALDSQTEAEIMEEIYRVGADKTLIVIAHRLSTISECDTIYKIENGIAAEWKTNTV